MVYAAFMQCLRDVYLDISAVFINRFSWRLHDDYVTFTSRLSDFYMTFTLSFTWRLFDVYMTFIWRLYDVLHGVYVIFGLFGGFQRFFFSLSMGFL